MRANDAGAGRGNEVIAAIVPLVVEDEEARRAAAVLRAGRRDLGDQRLQELRLARAKVANDPDVELVEPRIGYVEPEVAGPEAIDRLSPVEDDAASSFLHHGAAFDRSIGRDHRGTP